MAERHAAHVRAFTAEGASTRGRAGGRVPATAKAALRDLLRREQQAATAARAAATRVGSGDLAAALASYAACLAQHEVLLFEAAADAPARGRSRGADR